MCDENPYKKRKNLQTDGFTILELLLFLCGAGIVLVLLVPIYQTAREKATQRSTMADMAQWARAISAYTADHGAAPSNPRGRLNFKKPILKELTPYFSALRWSDWWGDVYWVWTGPGNDVYGFHTTDAKDYMIASLGEDNAFENWSYDPAHPEAGFYRPAEDKDYFKDIVLWYGQFIRRPEPEGNR